MTAAAIAADFTATTTDNGTLITGRSGRHYLARTIDGLVEVYRANRHGEARNRRVYTGPAPTRWAELFTALAKAGVR
ncbi:hypothetical protein PIS_067 [Saccharomonospora phage PIS 136]|nr:hypothetical protein PIS_067 [Saccharomonospora phage PIS 136]